MLLKLTVPSDSLTLAPTLKLHTRCLRLATGVAHLYRTLFLDIKSTLCSIMFLQDFITPTRRRACRCPPTIRTATTEANKMSFDVASKRRRRRARSRRRRRPTSSYRASYSISALSMNRFARFSRLL